jgi:hypothetical protein
MHGIRTPVRWPDLQVDRDPNLRWPLVAGSAPDSLVGGPTTRNPKVKTMRARRAHEKPHGQAVRHRITKAWNDETEHLSCIAAVRPGGERYGFKYKPRRGVPRTPAHPFLKPHSQARRNLVSPRSNITAPPALKRAPRGNTL